MRLVLLLDGCRYLVYCRFLNRLGRQFVEALTGFADGFRPVWQPFDRLAFGLKGEAQGRPFRVRDIKVTPDAKRASLVG
jgi:hypothetical protein